MAQVVLTTGDIIVLQEVEVHALQTKEDNEFTYVCDPSIDAQESFRWNFEVIRSLEQHHNYFDLDIGELMLLYEENMCLILDRI